MKSATCLALALSITGLSVSVVRAQLPNPPADARPVPADYDGDGTTDVSLKGSNGIWYIDVGRNGFGGRWDYAYPGYGGTAAVPVPADYDGDGKADLAAKTTGGNWSIDYAANLFGVWDVVVTGYGDGSAVPVPADYDGDRKADLATKDPNGFWLIDYAFDGFGTWNRILGGYGNATAVPVPADYDRDGKADLAVKDSNGFWLIDYAVDDFGAWNQILGGYGNAAAVPVPADYDNDARADLAVKDGNGFWLIDFASDGFGAWNASYSGRGGGWTIATPGDYDRDGSLDLSVKDTAGFWLIDLAVNSYAAWDLQIDNSNRQNVDLTAPWIEATEIYGPEGKIAPVNGQFPLWIGVRYMVALRINPGNGQYRAGVEINPDLYVPASLNVVNRVGSTKHVRITERHTRRFAFTPSAVGSFPLGFMMRDTDPPDGGTGNAFNQDYGVRVDCRSMQAGLYGTVSTRVQASSGRYVAGAPIGGAEVTSGIWRVRTAADGTWWLPATGGKHRVTITAAGYSDAVAVNVTVPEGGGVQIDTPLEEGFTALAQKSMRYTTYIDYSRGRTILHTVRLNESAATVRIEKSNPNELPPYFKRLSRIAADKGPAALALINGCWWDITNPTRNVGYFYSLGYMSSLVNPDDTFYVRDDNPSIPLELNPPMLTVSREIPLDVPAMPAKQRIQIATSLADFLTPSAQWGRNNSGYPIWDFAPRDKHSDVDYALQVAPFLLKDGAVIWRGEFDNRQKWDYLWAIPRTAVGLGPMGAMYLVVADGEGINGANGASQNQLGEFFRDVLGATTAMGFDGGLSSEMVLRGANGPRVINTITGEDSSWDIDPYTRIIQEADGGAGSVMNYLRVGS